MINILIVVGYIGSKRCYLNISEEEAKERYCEKENIPPRKYDELIRDGEITIEILEFVDEFVVYDLWEK